jgi:penicillin-binding protein-related factor A (putative recombinase)
LNIKKLYNTDKSLPLSEWVRLELKDKTLIKETKPHLSSFLKVSTKSHQKDLKFNYLGSFINLNNTIYFNKRGVILMSSTGTQGNASISISIIHQNFYKVTIAFTARRTIIGDWINDKDEYKINIK